MQEDEAISLASKPDMRAGSLLLGRRIEGHEVAEVGAGEEGEGRVNEIMTLPEKTIDTARQSRSTINGTISQLHKGGSTNKTSDQRPVVVLNSGYQVLNYIINERLKRIVEQTNVLEPGRVEVSTSTCKKCILSRMKPTDKESESIESRWTSEMPSMQCHRQLSGT